jgi:hypothetical protein
MRADAGNGIWLPGVEYDLSFPLVGSRWSSAFVRLFSFFAVAFVRLLVSWQQRHFGVCWGGG